MDALAATRDCENCDGTGTVLVDVSVDGELTTGEETCLECGGTGRDDDRPGPDEHGRRARARTWPASDFADDLGTVRGEEG